MNIFNFFRKQKFGTGAIDDLRTSEEKLKDYRFEELVSAPIVEWKEKPQSEWRKFPIRNQSQSGSCVAFSKAKELGIFNYLEEGEFVNLSARDIYIRRSNKPDAGMWGQDANQIAIKHGATLEILMPSEGLNEAAMNNDLDRKPSKEVIGMVFRPKSWIALPFNFDAIASIISKGTPVNLFFKFDVSEWNKGVPTINPNSQLSAHHSVVAIDYFLYQNKKSLLIEDSWSINSGIDGRRIITEDWTSRMTWASYFEDLSNLDLLKKEDIIKPKHRFEKDLGVGMKNNDIIVLQDILKYEELFPKTQISTGYFGGITRNAVQGFQRKYGIEPISGFVGILTRTKLNGMYF